MAVGARAKGGRVSANALTKKLRFQVEYVAYSKSGVRLRNRNAVAGRVETHPMALALCRYIDALPNCDLLRVRDLRRKR